MQTRNNATTKKMISGIIATISIIVIGAFAFSSFWFWTSLEIIAGLMVAVGCWGEWNLFKNPAQGGHESAHRRKELQYILAVAIGVTIEFCALLHSIPEAIRLEQNVVDIGTTNAWLVATNVGLEIQLNETKTELANAERLLNESVDNFKMSFSPMYFPDESSFVHILQVLSGLESRLYPKEAAQIKAKADMLMEIRAHIKDLKRKKPENDRQISELEQKRDSGSLKEFTPEEQQKYNALIKTRWELIEKMPFLYADEAGIESDLFDIDEQILSKKFETMDLQHGISNSPPSK